MAKRAKEGRRDWTKLDPEAVKEVLVDLTIQPDIYTVKVCGKACVEFRYLNAPPYRIDSLPPSVIQNIPALINKVHELTRVPF